MNVLVYSGNEIISLSYLRAVNHLKAHLLPKYTVQPISKQALLSQPWASHCSLLVFPALHDFSLSENLGKIIRSFVSSGGAFLALSAMIDLAHSEVPQSSDRLHFMNDQGCSITLQFLSSPSSPAIEQGNVRFTDNSILHDIVQVVPPVTFNQELHKGLQVLAHTEDGGDYGIISPSAFLSDIQSGRVLLVHAPIETGPDNLVEERHHAFRLLLTACGLSPSPHPFCEVSPLPQYLVSSPNCSAALSPTIQAIQKIAQITNDGVYNLQDTNDTFSFRYFEQREKVFKDYLVEIGGKSQPRQIIICPNGQLPNEDETPGFDLRMFFSELASRRGSKKSTNTSQVDFSLGDVILYGERVSSTQTMLDKNPQFLDLLPSSLVSIASEQLAGRGRGSNLWLSPAGCLQFSLHLRVNTITLPPNKLVFIQYLFGLAVIEACHSISALRSYADAIKLKWPNDLYCQTPEGEQRKIGGILVNTIFGQGEVDVVIGCGLNVLNDPPIQSIAQLLPLESRNKLKMESLAAAILVTFDEMWHQFLNDKGAFDSFMDLYLSRWLHSDQLITITTTNPPINARIVGLTSDHGLLRTMSEHDTPYGSSFIDLQPDGNSFDLMTGLVRTKH